MSISSVSFKHATRLCHRPLSSLSSTDTANLKCGGKSNCHFYKMLSMIIGERPKAKTVLAYPVRSLGIELYVVLAFKDSPRKPLGRRLHKT